MNQEKIMQLEEIINTKYDNITGIIGLKNGVTKNPVFTCKIFNIRIFLIFVRYSHRHHISNSNFLNCQIIVFYYIIRKKIYNLLINFFYITFI